MRSWLRLPVARLRRNAVPVTEATASATLAWVLDTQLVHHPAPFFAPAAALIVLGQARGHRWRRAVEVVLGVAGGVFVADVVAQTLGAHQTLTIFVVIVFTLVLSTAIGASTVFTVQAGVSALYVAVVEPASGARLPFRFVDALVGGGVALVVSQLAYARDPLARLARETHAVLAEVIGVLDDAAAALEQHDAAAARRALDRARAAEASVTVLHQAVDAADEALLFHLRQRERRGGVRAVDLATGQLDYIARSVRGLTRAGVALNRLPDPPPPDLARGVRCCATALRGADATLTEQLGADAAETARNVAQTRASALAGLRIAGPLVMGGAPLPVLMMVGQLRTITIDILRAVGLGDAELLQDVDAALAGQ